MTSTTTNGASLEDCLTNIFSLIDLNGIRWKRFKHKENNNYLYTPIDTHPILTTYSKCIEENHIAAWRNEPQKRHSPGGGGGGPSSGGAGGGTGSTGHSNFPTPTRASNNNTPTGGGPSSGHHLASATSSGGNQNNNSNNNNNPGGDNSATNSNNQNNYELWIFGYGDQLKVDDVIGDDLVEIEDDTWEQKGLSYECRILLFKALHNLITRCFINKGFTRIGRWFVRPLLEQIDYSACCHDTTTTTTTTNHSPLSSSTNHNSRNSLKHLKSEQSSSINPPISSSNHSRITSNSNLNLSSAISSSINSYIDSRCDLFDKTRISGATDKSDGLRHTSTRSSNTHFTTSLDGSKSSLSFAIGFFVHGNNTICATVDVRQHPLVHPITRADLATFQAGGIVRVALAPFGLNGILNGVHYKDSDNGAATTTFIQQWSRFYPLPKTMSRLVPPNKSSSTSSSSSSSTNSAIPTSNFHHHQKNSSASTPNQFNQAPDGSRSYLSNLTNMLLPPSSKPILQFNHEPHEVPPVVEVIVGGHKMRYPSECVFTTARVVDHYKSVQSVQTSHLKTTNSSPANRRAAKLANSKPNKLSLLSEKLTDTASLDPKVKIEPEQQQPDFISPCRISSSQDKKGSGDTTTIRSLLLNQTSNSDINMNKDKNPNESSDSESNTTTTNNNNNNFSNSTYPLAQTTTTTISRYSNSTKLVGGFTSNNTPLGPTDLVKLFPTPPSLEQIILSPSAITSDETAKDTKEDPMATIHDNGIDVYKPVECALMPPPPKWAALTNIVIASSRSLPPECIYKGSPQKQEQRKSIMNKFCESIKGNLASSLLLSPKSSNKQLNSLLDKSRNSPMAPSPLADQTNKNNGIGMNPPTPKLTTTTTTTSLLSHQLTSQTSSIFSPSSQHPPPPPPQSTIIQSSPISLSSATLTSSSITTTTTTTTTTFPAYTLPHQRLFNNLHEVNSIQLNLILCDSVLGMFHDHNFENCTLCVCNMSIKGNPPDVIPQTKSDPNQWRQSTNNDNSSSLLAAGGTELTNECTCGFSAMTNRHYSHLSGLFLEDELEITNVLYDPTEMIDQNKLFRKMRLSNYSESSLSDEQKAVARLLNLTTDLTKTAPGKEDTNLAKGVSPTTTTSTTTTTAVGGSKSTDVKSAIKEEKSSQSCQNLYEESKLFVIDQLKQQCSTMIHSNSSLTKEIIVESFRNNRHLTNCSNYYAQLPNKMTGAGSPFQKFLDETNRYTTVKLNNRNPSSLKFSDYCELVKGYITKLGNQSQQQQQQQNNSSRLTSSLVKSYQGLESSATTTTSSNLSSIFTRMFSPNNRQSALIGKSIDSHGNSRNSIFLQGLQALVLPTLSIDPEGTLSMLEQLAKEESKEVRATLNKAILIFSSPMHDWQYITAPIPENNFDVANLLKVLQPQLNEAVGSHNKLYKDYVHMRQQHDYSSRDSPTGAPVVPTPPCQGPLTWRQFHQAAGRGTEDQCEPQPIPSLLVSYHVDKSQFALSPFALKFWDKLLLEPYAPGHNMYYVVVAPDNPNTLGYINGFFKELSNIYELLKLGKHTPIGTGILTTSDKDNTIPPSEENWFSKLSYDEKDIQTNTIVARIKAYAAQMTANLAKTIEQFIDELQPPYDPHADRFDSSPTAPEPKTSNTLIARTNQGSNKPLGNLLGLNQANQSQPAHHHHHHHQQQQPPPAPHQIDQMFGNFPNENQAQMSLDSHSSQQHPHISSAIKSHTLINSSTAHSNNEDNTYLEDEASKQSGIVVYMIDPFSSASISQNMRTLATVCLMKCYSMLVDHLPENLKRITQLQLISLDSIISHSRPSVSLSRIDQLKSLSMNVYARCRKILTNQITAKSLTGFGPAAALEQFFKTKSHDISVSRMFTPPFILAPMKDKQTELGESYGHLREKSSVLFCSYCITEDQRWLLASVTNEKGELSESTVININVLDRMKKPRTSIKRVALRKLMEFIVSVMSDWVIPWRLIIGKLGRVGHGELKEWATLLSKRSLLNYSRHLTERCRQCSVLPPNETVCILSACLVSLEPDSKLRIMPDQFTSDDRQASFNKCPLSTPEDASATHILVFPTSASIQPNQGNVEELLVGSGLEDDLNFPLDDGIEDLGVEENMDDIFSACNDLNPFNVSDPIGSSHNDTMMSTSNLQMGSVSCGDSAGNQDETLQLLQQPLALGYYMSTAKIGQMPNWFWSTSPHLRNSCPVFLKSALHIHMPYVQLSDDLLHSNVVQSSRRSHQLDSHMTTDVLRYVLEGYNALSWLALNPKSYDRQSCLPVHMQNLLQLYHLMESFS